MLSSQNKPLRSTVNSSRASSTSVKKDGFFMYAYKRMMEFLTNFWNRTRRFLWISSTGKDNCYSGFILLVLPFAFAYIS